MLWTLFLLLNGLLALVFIYLSRSRQKNEPPLDKGFIPWLGHALEFGKDAARFLTRMKLKHGDIFTVRVAGQYVTVLLDPNSYDDILNDTEALDFTSYKDLLLQRIFSLQLHSSDQDKERAWMEKHFQGGSLSRLSSSMHIHLQDLFAASQETSTPAEWKQEGLFSLCYSLLFRAGYLTLFGSERGSNVAAVYKEFRQFDNLLTKLARSTLKQGEKRTALSSRARLWDLLSPSCLSGGTHSGSWQQRYRQYLQEEGVDAEMQRRAMLLQLWTTQGNAGPAAFWMLAFLLTHPEAMSAVQAELRGLPEQVKLLGLHPHHAEETGSGTPVLDGVLNETLRLTAAALITREVVRDRSLILRSGQEYRLRRGDRVCLFPFLSPQMDPEIHHKPQVFKYDRFLNEDLTRKKTFHKGGVRMKYYTMPWGAGSNVCVGKQFAISGIKQFVYLVLTRMDLELCGPEASVPPINPSRYGFGMLQPDGDLPIRHRMKRT